MLHVKQESASLLPERSCSSFLCAARPEPRRGGEASPSYEPYRGRGDWSPSQLRDRSASPKRPVVRPLPRPFNNEASA